MNPVEIVERQLAAYNSSDLDAFCAAYADDILVFNQGNPAPLISGKDAFRERYRERFSNKDLHAVIIARMCVADCVIDHETVTGITGGPSSVGVIYHIKDGFIDKMWFIR